MKIRTNLRAGARAVGSCSGGGGRAVGSCSGGGGGGGGIIRVNLV